MCKLADVLFANSHYVVYFQEKLRVVTILGAGLLVGTALAVIIPEGVHALLSPADAHEHGIRMHSFPCGIMQV